MSDIRLQAAVALDTETFVWYYRAIYNRAITFADWAAVGKVLYTKYPGIGVLDSDGTCDEERTARIRNALLALGYDLYDLSD